jgi:hypothetical protein
VEALLVGNGREGVIGVDDIAVLVFMRDIELSEGMICAESFDGLLCSSALVLHMS